MFRAFSRPSSGAQRLKWQPLVLPSYRGDSSAVFVVGPADLFELNVKLRCEKVNVRIKNKIGKVFTSKFVGNRPSS
jgi:hypothetical protein